jgi:DNA-directed RNA polymerase specialized sigma24 family protein
LDDADESALLAGFRAGDEAQYAAFFALLMPAVRSLAKARWPSLKHLHRDIENEALATLVEWRASGLLREGETTAELASRLVHESARAAKRVEKRDERLIQAQKYGTPEEKADAEAELIVAELRKKVWELQSTLAPKDQRVLEAHVRAETGQQSLEEILDVPADTARKLMQRAREAIAAAIRKAGLKAADLLEVPDAAP